MPQFLMNNALLLILVFLSFYIAIKSLAHYSKFRENPLTLWWGLSFFLKGVEFVAFYFLTPYYKIPDGAFLAHVVDTVSIWMMLYVLMQLSGQKREGQVRSSILLLFLISVLLAAVSSLYLNSPSFHLDALDPMQAFMVIGSFPVDIAFEISHVFIYFCCALLLTGVRHLGKAYYRLWAGYGCLSLSEASEVLMISALWVKSKDLVPGLFSVAVVFRWVGVLLLCHGVMALMRLDRQEKKA